MSNKESIQIEITPDLDKIVDPQESSNSDNIPLSDTQEVFLKNKQHSILSTSNLITTRKKISEMLSPLKESSADNTLERGHYSQIRKYFENNLKKNTQFMKENLHKKTTVEKFLERTSPMVLKTYIFFLKTIFCAIIVPILGGLGGFFDLSNQNTLEIISKVSGSIIANLWSENGDILTFMSGKIYNNLVEPWLLEIPYFSDFIKLVNVGKEISEEIDNWVFTFLSRKIFNKDTLYALKLHFDTIRSFVSSKKKDKNFNLQILKGDLQGLASISAAFFGLFDIIICGTRQDSLCRRIKIIEKIAYLCPLISDLTIDILEIMFSEEFSGHRQKHNFSEIIFKSFCQYCTRQFKLDEQILDFRSKQEEIELKERIAQKKREQEEAERKAKEEAKLKAEEEAKKKAEEEEKKRKQLEEAKRDEERKKKKEEKKRTNQINDKIAKEKIKLRKFIDLDDVNIDFNENLKERMSLERDIHLIETEMKKLSEEQLFWETEDKVSSVEVDGEYVTYKVLTKVATEKRVDYKKLEIKKRKLVASQKIANQQFNMFLIKQIEKSKSKLKDSKKKVKSESETSKIKTLSREQQQLENKINGLLKEKQRINSSIFKFIDELGSFEKQVLNEYEKLEDNIQKQLDSTLNYKTQIIKLRLEKDYLQRDRNQQYQDDLKNEEISYEIVKHFEKELKEQDPGINSEERRSLNLRLEKSKKRYQENKKQTIESHKNKAILEVDLRRREIDTKIRELEKRLRESESESNKLLSQKIGRGIKTITVEEYLNTKIEEQRQHQEHEKENEKLKRLQTLQSKKNHYIRVGNYELAEATSNALIAEKRKQSKEYLEPNGEIDVELEEKALNTQRELEMKEEIEVIKDSNFSSRFRNTQEDVPLYTTLEELEEGQGYDEFLEMFKIMQRKNLALSYDDKGEMKEIENLPEGFLEKSLETIRNTIPQGIREQIPLSIRELTSKKITNSGDLKTELLNQRQILNNIKRDKDILSENLKKNTHTMKTLKDEEQELKNLLRDKLRFEDLKKSIPNSFNIIEKRTSNQQIPDLRSDEIEKMKDFLDLKTSSLSNEELISKMKDKYHLLKNKNIDQLNQSVITVEDEISTLENSNKLEFQKKNNLVSDVDIREIFLNKLEQMVSEKHNISTTNTFEQESLKSEHETLRDNIERLNLKLKSLLGGNSIFGSKDFNQLTSEQQKEYRELQRKIKKNQDQQNTIEKMTDIALSESLGTLTSKDKKEIRKEKKLITFFKKRKLAQQDSKYLDKKREIVIQKLEDSKSILGSELKNKNRVKYLQEILLFVENENQEDINKRIESLEAQVPTYNLFFGPSRKEIKEKRDQINLEKETLLKEPQVLENEIQKIRDNQKKIKRIDYQIEVLNSIDLYGQEMIERSESKRSSIFKEIASNNQLKELRQKLKLKRDNYPKNSLTFDEIEANKRDLEVRISDLKIKILTEKNDPAKEKLMIKIDHYQQILANNQKEQQKMRKKKNSYKKKEVNLNKYKDEANQINPDNLETKIIDLKFKIKEGVDTKEEREKLAVFLESFREIIDNDLKKAAQDIKKGAQKISSINDSENLNYLDDIIDSLSVSEKSSNNIGDTTKANEINKKIKNLKESKQKHEEFLANIKSELTRAQEKYDNFEFSEAGDDIREVLFMINEKKKDYQKSDSLNLSKPLEDMYRNNKQFYQKTKTKHDEQMKKIISKMNELLNQSNKSSVYELLVSNPVSERNVIQSHEVKSFEELINKNPEYFEKAKKLIDEENLRYLNKGKNHKKRTTLKNTMDNKNGNLRGAQQKGSHVSRKKKITRKKIK